MDGIFVLSVSQKWCLASVPADASGCRGGSRWTGIVGEAGTGGEETAGGEAGAGCSGGGNCGGSPGAC